MVSNFASGFFTPEGGIAIDAASYLYVTDYVHSVIKRVGHTGAVTPVAGALNVAGWVDGSNTSALFSSPWGIAVDSFTNIYVSDNDSNVIRKMSRIGSTRKLGRDHHSRFARPDRKRGWDEQ